MMGRASRYPRILMTTGRKWRLWRNAAGKFLVRVKSALWGIRAAKALRNDPQEAAIFARDSGVDAMAISVGQRLHLQTDHEGGLDETRIRAIEALTQVPLVIHGGSGVPYAQRAALAAGSKITKFNIGTKNCAWQVWCRAASRCQCRSCAFLTG